MMGGKSIGVQVNSEFEQCGEHFHTIVIVDSYIDLDFSIIYNAIIKDVKKGKNIICLKKLKEKDYESLFNICNSNGSSFEYFIGNEWTIDAASINENLLDINTPVIFVTGTAHRTGKFNLQLALRNELRKYGYKIDCFNLSNIKFDYQSSDEIGKKCYLIIDEDFIDEKCRKYNSIQEKPIFNSLNGLDMSKLSTYIIDLLSGSASIENII